MNWLENQMDLEIKLESKEHEKQKNFHQIYFIIQKIVTKSLQK